MPYPGDNRRGLILQERQGCGAGRTLLNDTLDTAYVYEVQTLAVATPRHWDVFCVGNCVCRTLFKISCVKYLPCLTFWARDPHGGCFGGTLVTSSVLWVGDFVYMLGVWGGREGSLCYGERCLDNDGHRRGPGERCGCIGRSIVDYRLEWREEYYES